MREVLSGPLLPNAQHKYAAKPAAVLVIIYDSDPYILMTKRSRTMSIHAGEISFPGGSWYYKDLDLLDTALRETREELGVTVSREDVIGQLTPVTTLNSGFMITPFVTMKEEIGPVRPNSEIDSILRIPLIPLLQTMATDSDPAHRSIQEMYVFRFQNHLIWGASARILKQIVSLFSTYGLF